MVSVNCSTTLTCLTFSQPAAKAAATKAAKAPTSKTRPASKKAKVNNIPIVRSLIVY
jgi:hypothetical protein